ncbi:hypothetical protein MSM1_17810 [Mycobacterium sp. SM1]|uniref:hypothetical protein n=1 Tax=Mycobacterium sp. SM1 TaxID=2816243 RepID=UPI001BCDAC25|nr:hypothetical protein [Mycobacterium sp. SM1]MBS4730109.1 hypothetical protein [Mycobacterium sp. SM1]
MKAISTEYGPNAAPTAPERAIGHHDDVYRVETERRWYVSLLVDDGPAPDTVVGAASCRVAGGRWVAGRVL